MPAANLVAGASAEGVTAVGYNVPLGEAPGEANLQTPFNTSPTVVLVTVKNHSAAVKRRVLKTAVSFYRNGSNSSRKKAGELSADDIQKSALYQDMNDYDDEVKPVNAVLTFDNRKYVIPHAEKGKEPEAVPVPEGLYDLYCGNYQRMNSKDHNERSRELERLSTRFRYNPVMQGVDRDGNPVNPYGFLEFIRTEVIPQAAAIDLDRVYPGNIAEV